MPPSATANSRFGAVENVKRGASQECSRCGDRSAKVVCSTSWRKRRSLRPSMRWMRASTRTKVCGPSHSTANKTTLPSESGSPPLAAAPQGSPLLVLKRNSARRPTLGIPGTSSRTAGVAVQVIVPFTALRTASVICICGAAAGSPSTRIGRPPRVISGWTTDHGSSMLRNVLIVGASPQAPAANSRTIAASRPDQRGPGRFRRSAAGASFEGQRETPS